MWFPEGNKVTNAHYHADISRLRGSMGKEDGAKQELRHAHDMQREIDMADNPVKTEDDLLNLN